MCGMSLSNFTISEKVQVHYSWPRLHLSIVPFSLLSNGACLLLSYSHPRHASVPQSLINYILCNHEIAYHFLYSFDSFCLWQPVPVYWNYYKVFCLVCLPQLYFREKIIIFWDKHTSYSVKHDTCSQFNIHFSLLHVGYE